MSIHLQKLASQPALYYQYEGAITLHDLTALEAREEPYFSALRMGEQLHVIIDLHAIDTIAAPLFPKLQRIYTARSSQIGLMVSVGANPYLRALTKSLCVIINHPDMLHCATLNEALACILVETMFNRVQPAVSARET